MTTRAMTYDNSADLGTLSDVLTRLTGISISVVSVEATIRSDFHTRFLVTCEQGDWSLLSLEPAKLVSPTRPTSDPRRA